MICNAHDMSVVAETDDPRSVFGLMSRLQPDVFMLAVVTFLPSHLELFAEISHSYPHCKIVMLSPPLDDDALAIKAFVKGLAGHLEAKTAISAPALPNFIRTVSKGGTIIPPRLMKVVVDELFGCARATL